MSITAAVPPAELRCRIGCTVDPAGAIEYRQLTAGLVLPDGVVFNQLSPLQPFVLAWSTFDYAVGSLTGNEAQTVVHLSQEIVMQRPMTAGERIFVDLDVVGIRQERGGARMCFLSTFVDRSGIAFGEMYTGLLAVEATLPSMGRIPRHPANRVEEWDAAVVAEIPAGFPSRYANAVADHNPIHLNDAVARQHGLDGVIVHGMSVLAVVVETAIARYAEGDADRVLGVGTRFSSPVRPGEPFNIHFDNQGVVNGRVNFHCRTATGVALKSGWVHVDN